MSSLPAEICLKIFEALGRLDSPEAYRLPSGALGTICSVTLASKALHEAISPILYRHVYIDKSNIRPFCRTITTELRGYHLGSLVRTLFVQELTWEGDVEDLSLVASAFRSMRKLTRIWIPDLEVSDETLDKAAASLSWGDVAPPLQAFGASFSSLGLIEELCLDLRIDVDIFTGVSFTSMYPHLRRLLALPRVIVEQVFPLLPVGDTQPGVSPIEIFTITLSIYHALHLVDAYMNFLQQAKQVLDNAPRFILLVSEDDIGLYESQWAKRLSEEKQRVVKALWSAIPLPQGMDGLGSAVVDKLASGELWKMDRRRLIA